MFFGHTLYCNQESEVTWNPQDIYAFVIHLLRSTLRTNNNAIRSSNPSQCHDCISKVTDSPFPNPHLISLDARFCGF